MKKFLSIVIIAVMMMTMAGFSAFADELTVAGTPRSETLVVEGLDGVIGNPGQSNPHMDGTNFSCGRHQLVYSNLWEMDTIKGVQIPDLAAELPIPLNDDYTSFKVVLTEGIKWSDGEEFDEFALMCQNSGMNDCVIQLGFRTDSAEMLKSSDLYLNSSSKNEAMSFAILEAMNAGIPLVVTDVGGNRDLAETNTVCGRVLQFGDSDGFSDAILELMENEALLKEFSDNALKKVSDEFDLEKLALDVFNAYN